MKLVLLAITAVILSSCTSPINVTGVDNDPTSFIDSSYIPNGCENVSIYTGNIGVRFNEDLASDTNDGTHFNQEYISKDFYFKIEPEDKSLVHAVLGPNYFIKGNEVWKNVNITTTTPFRPNTWYVVKINGAKTKSGRTMTREYSSRFKTGEK